MKSTPENISYYNAIAGEYNEMLDKDSDRIIRETVAGKFSNIAEAAAILDFGGGTGMDLPWLSERNKTVFFCEPSTGMREKAIASRGNFPNDNVIFLSDIAADFRQWPLQLPFPGKVDAVLSNFAVLNCIPDIELLFQNMALVIKPGGNVMALVLSRTSEKSKINFRSILKSVIHHEPVTMRFSHKQNHQTVYIYTVKEIRRASEKYFNFCSAEILAGSGFTLLHLKRK